ncbi:MAG: hypothetical protein ACFFFB_17335 [Candidatus Heimdallarchaeota archaeon]
MEIITQKYEIVLIPTKEEVREFESPDIEFEVDDLLGDLNPRYFEEINSLEDAKNKAYSLEVNIPTNNSFFGGY